MSEGVVIFYLNNEKRSDKLFFIQFLHLLQIQWYFSTVGVHFFKVH